jgi:hypothetical protein
MKHRVSICRSTSRHHYRLELSREEAGAPKGSDRRVRLVRILSARGARDAADLLRAYTHGIYVKRRGF